jgi:hypothetical protein
MERKPEMTKVERVMTSKEIVQADDWGPVMLSYKAAMKLNEEDHTI